MKNIWAIFLILFCLQLSGQKRKLTWDTKADEKYMGNELANSMQRKSYKKMEFLFTYELKKKLSLSKLKGMVEKMTEQYGSVEKILDLYTQQKAEDTYYRQGSQCEKKKFDIVFTLNEERDFDKIRATSFKLSPYKVRPSWEMPDYVNHKLFEVIPIKIGEEAPLLGEYTLATKQPKQIFVVMIHGSGPNDMDESIGPNKFFKDLAYGLGSNGISCIRYNKRTYDYPRQTLENFNSLTIDQVVIQDAVQAIEKAKELGADQIILLGHSLGGHLAPMIAERTKVDAVIVMAANVSPLEDMILPQVEYLMKNDTSSTISEVEYNALEYQVKNVQKGNFDSTVALPFGLPPVFWKSLENYKPNKVSKKQDIPYLILNGERDYQVTPKEAKKWKDGNKHPKSKTIIYPNLNHLFHFGKGKSLPTEYQKKAHVEEKVINELVNWIKSLEN